MPGWAMRVPIRSAVERPLWTELRGANGPRTVSELHVSCRACPIAINQRLNRWVRAGIVDASNERPKRYAMIDPATRPAAPPRIGRDQIVRDRTPTQQTLMWRAMRVLGSFDIPMIEIVAGARRGSVQSYILNLCRSGHLQRQARSRARAGNWAMYRLVRNTGPAAPSVARRGKALHVIDRNTDTRIDVSPGVVSLRENRKSPASADGGEG